LRQRFAAANNDDSTQSFNSSQALAPSGGGASDDFVSALGVFINGHSSSGSTEGGIFQQNTDTSSSSLSLGADYRFNNNIVAGLGVGFLQDQNDFAAAGGSIDSESFNTTAYATWFNADLYFDIVLDIALAEYDVQRSIALAPGTEVNASSTVDSSLRSLTISGGKNFRLANWDLGGYFRLSLSRGQIDGFSESINEEQTGFGTAFSVDDQTVESTEGVLGFEVSRAFSLQKAVLVPLLRLEYVSNIERDKEDIQSNLLLTDTDFEYFGDQREASYYNLGIGTSAVFAKGRSLYAFYETHLQHDTINNNWIKAGVRFEF
jgi:outer membrane autotransporter protein